MILYPQKNIHWDYYLALEDDLIKISRFIEFNEDNYNTYSIELAHLLLAAASEVDVILKQLCIILSPEYQPKNKNFTMYDYKKVIKKSLPGGIELPVINARRRLNLSPWHNWLDKDKPEWWTAYNKIKHQRHDHFHQANLKNVLHALAGLYVANVYFHHYKFHSKEQRILEDIGYTLNRLSPASNFLEPEDPMMRLLRLKVE